MSRSQGCKWEALDNGLVSTRLKRDEQCMLPHFYYIDVCACVYRNKLTGMSDLAIASATL